jgi:hypothetical protein
VGKGKVGNLINGKFIPVLAMAVIATAFALVDWLYL